jgi:hypothetical protein
MFRCINMRMSVRGFPSGRRGCRVGGKEEEFYRDAAMQEFCCLANCFAVRAFVADRQPVLDGRSELKEQRNEPRLADLNGQTDYGDDLGRRD